MRRLAFYGLLLAMISSCAEQKPDESGMTVFRYNEFSNISSLDPAFAKDQASIWACNQIYNGLLQLDEDLNILPCIAHSWNIDTTGRIYTFFLRNDVFFHDHPAFPGGIGRKVTAHDFVFSLKRLQDPKLASPGIWVLNKIEKEDGEPAIAALNDTILQIRLKEPFSPFPGILTMIYCSVVPKEVVAEKGIEFRINPTGTGPFRFKMWKENVKLVLVKNTGYFEKDSNQQRLPYLDAIAISFLIDKQAAFLEFIKGNLDFISGLDQSYKDELLTKDGHLKAGYQDKFMMMTEPFLNTEYVGMLVDSLTDAGRNSPLMNKKVRQAINYGIDRRKMIRYIRNNIGVPGLHGIIPPGLPAFDSSEVFFDYDPQKAQALIREAGYGPANPLPAITLHTTAEYTDIFKYMQHQLSSLGISVKIEVNPAATLMQLKAYSRINFFRASWIADYPDEENYLSLFVSTNAAPAGPNYTRYNNPVFDSLYKASQLVGDPVIRKDIYRQMNGLVMEDAPVIILYYDQVVRFSWTYIQNLGTNPLNMLNLKSVKKIQEE